MLGFKVLNAGLNSTAVAAIVLDVSAGLSAAGANQATATALSNTLNGFTTVALSTGAILYAGSGGDSQVVYNGGANTLSVYPPVGAQINALGANNAYALLVNTGATFWFLSSTQIIVILSA